MRTDLLVLHFMNDVDEDAALSFGGAPVCEGTPSAVEWISAAKSGAQIQLSWDSADDSVCFDSYRVYMSAAGDWAAVTDLDDDETDTTWLLDDSGAAIERYLVTTVDINGAEGPLRP